MTKTTRASLPVSNFPVVLIYIPLALKSCVSVWITLCPTTVRDTIPEEEKPQHFSIEQAPEDEIELVERNAQLAKLGITAIWFEKGCYDYVESILRLAKNELRYQGLNPRQRKTSEYEDSNSFNNNQFFQRIKNFFEKTFNWKRSNHSL